MDLGVLADINSGAYKVTKLLHILTAIAGLGVTFWYGVYGARSKKHGESGDALGSAAIAEANVVVGTFSEYVIWTIPLFGIGLVFMSDDAWGFDQTWVWLALVVYAIALANALFVLQPSAERIATLSRELASMSPPPAGATGPPPQVAEIDATAKRLGAFSGINHVIVVILLYLMIWKPGL